MYFLPLTFFRQKVKFRALRHLKMFLWFCTHFEINIIKKIKCFQTAISSEVMNCPKWIYQERVK